MANVTMKYRIEANVTGNINYFTCVDSLNNVVDIRKSIRREYKYCVVVRVPPTELIDSLEDAIGWCKDGLRHLPDTDTRHRPYYERRIEELTADIKRIQDGLYNPRESREIIPQAKSWHETFERAQQHARKIEKNGYYEMLGIATI